MQPVTQNLRQPPPAAAPESARLVSKRARNVVVGVLSGALALALSYWIGRAEGSAKADALEQRAEQQQKGQQKSAEQLREQLEQSEQRVKQLEARRALHQSLMALELDNFGTAREHLAKTLSWVQAQKPVPGSALSQFEESLSRVELTVTADPMPQRVELTQLAAAFDAMLAP